MKVSTFCFSLIGDYFTRISRAAFGHVTAPDKSNNWLAGIIDQFRERPQSD